MTNEFLTETIESFTNARDIHAERLRIMMDGVYAKPYFLVCESFSGMLLVDRGQGKQGLGAPHVGMSNVLVFTLDAADRLAKRWNLGCETNKNTIKAVEERAHHTSEILKFQNYIDDMKEALEAAQ